MSELIEEAGPGANAPEYTVSELSGAVKRTLEGAFGRVRVRGEVGRVTIARSGHVYLDLKDAQAVLSSVIWKGQAAKLEVMPEEGMEVVATGRLTTFQNQSRYQLVIEEVAPAGLGALMAMLEKRRAALAAEGLFDAARKKPLPRLPEVIGVVTSPTGAVIRDILHRLRERFPRHVLIWPVAVQGRTSGAEVAAAIRGFNALEPGGPVPRPDLLIVARGGGSVEDLWGFNEEIVVRAAAESAIPLISAVGHETDTTLIDHAADRRAPTPTAAAEIAVPVRAELLAGLAESGARLARSGARAVETRRQRLADLARALPRPADLVDRRQQRLDDVGARLLPALRGLVQGRRLALADQAQRLRPSVQMAAAEARLGRLAARLGPGLRLALGRRQAALAQAAAGLRPGGLERRIRQSERDLAGLVARLARAGGRQVGDRQAQLAGLARLLGGLGYRATLARGYAVVRGDGGQVVTTRAAAAGAGALEIEFADGRLGVGAAAQAETPRGRGRKPPPGQGSLF